MTGRRHRTASASGLGRGRSRAAAGLVAALAACAPARAAAQSVLPPVSVTATRAAGGAADASAPIDVVDRRVLDSSASRTLDDVLRRIPGFSLFRRLGSGAAHPTTQGVSLRGIGPSGTSRALVLVDGVPLNDPFGGWVLWNRIPSETVEKVEVLRGSGASLWGNYAMGGVVGVTTRAPAREGAGLVAEGGERGSGRTEAWAARRLGDASVMLDGRWMRSGDYPLVSADTRGPIDIPGGSEHEEGGVRVDSPVGPGATARLVARGFHDDRDNGTPYTRNRTSLGFFRTGLDVERPWMGRVAADVFGTVQEFASTFSAVSADRASETPASDQYSVPSSSVGSSLVWTAPEAGAHRLSAGVDTMWVVGQSRELARYLDGAFTRRRSGGAEQAMEGIFVQDLFRATDRLDVTAALRFDHWQSYDGFRRENDLANGAALVDRPLASRSEDLLSPRLGLAYAALPGLVLRTAAYRGFRAPTINEQVRPFRVRNDITEANEALDAEKLWGVDAGFDAGHGPWTLSSTFFWNQVDDPVFNVTVGEGPGPVDPCGFVPAGGTCRQRRNLGETRILGVEASLGVALGRGFGAGVSYLWNDGEVTRSPDEPALEGNRLPQVPRHQGTFTLDWDDGGPWRASLVLRVVGEQFDDDANTRTLDAFAAVDAFVARRLGGGFEAFVAAENLFDETIENSRSADGVVGIAAPRLVRGGLRYTFGGAAD